MAVNAHYYTAGLQVPKDDGQSPGGANNTVYMTAGLVPEVEVAAGVTVPVMMRYYMNRRTA